ncbi:hypothetical protein EV359DRAFT_87065 [Lentinula novae-zelandiae]|nr:hypothetical protein EV359DRAFT_87065 [Lentinula novae-zelandiae]
MAVRTLQSVAEDSVQTEPTELYHLFKEAAPYLLYIYNFWMSRANCPLFAEQVLLEQQWGVPPEHQSSSLGAPVFEHFPTIPIPFCLLFREGSAMMHLAPSKDLDPFVSLCGKSSSAVASKIVTPSPSLEINSSTSVSKAPVAPPCLVRRNWKQEDLKIDASTFFSSPCSTRSRGSDNEFLSGSPSVDTAPLASLSTKASVVRREPKSKTTVKGLAPPRSRKITLTASKGKARQMIATDEDLTSNEVESEDEDEKEDAVPPPKCLKTTSSISASLPCHSVKQVSVPKRVTKAAVRPAPERSPASTFQPVLLADTQGHLWLPNQSSGEFTSFPKFAHARRCLKSRASLAVNQSRVSRAGLHSGDPNSTMQDLMQINQVIRDPSIPSQACISVLACRDLEEDSAPLPGYKCQACSSRSLKSLGSLDVELAMDALNALHTTSVTKRQRRSD